MAAPSITARSCLWGQFQKACARLDVATLMLVAVGVHDPLGPGPLLDWPVLSESFELPFPKLSVHERSGIGPNQPFASPLGGSADANLSNIILNPDDIGLVFAVDILDANISPKDRLA